MYSRFLVRDQEVVGSNPIAPTNLLESSTYKTERSKERLVRSHALVFKCEEKGRRFWFEFIVLQ
jgi:hypothetical protein